MVWPPNGRRYRQARELAGKTTRRRIRRWGHFPESAGNAPHLSGARGVGQVLQDGFDFDLDIAIHHWTAYFGEWIIALNNFSLLVSFSFYKYKLHWLSANFAHPTSIIFLKHLNF